MLHKVGEKYQVRREFRATVDTVEEARYLDDLCRLRHRDLRNSFSDGLSSTIGIREGIEKYCRHARVKRGTKKKRLDFVKRVLEWWADALSSGAGDVPLDRITYCDLDEVIERRLACAGYRGQSLNRQTVGKELGVLRSYALWASGKARQAPKDLDLLSYEFECAPDAHHGGEVRWMPLPDFMRCVGKISAGNPQVGILLASEVFFGLRPEALVELRWRHVFLPRNKDEVGLVKASALKGGTHGNIPVPFGSVRHQILSRAKKLFQEFGHREGRVPRPGDPVFPSRRGNSARNRYGWTVDVLDREVRRLADKHGFDSSFVAYIGRHSAITFLQDTEAVGAGQVQRYSQHSAITTQDIYSHGRGANLAFEVLEEKFGGAARVILGSENNSEKNSQNSVQPLFL